MLGGQGAATMNRKPNRKLKKPAKTVLRLPDLEHARNAVLNSLSSVMLRASIAMRLTSSLIGTVPSLVWRPTGSSSYRTVRTWNLAVWLQVYSSASSTGPLWISSARVVM